LRWSLKEYERRQHGSEAGPARSQSAHPYEGNASVELLRLSALFALTALAEVTGWCSSKTKTAQLTLTAAGQAYAAYGGMYITVASIYGNHSPLRKAPRKR